jgi:MFS family permease
VALSGINGIAFALFLVGGVTYVSRHAPPAIAATVQGVFQGVGIGLAQLLGAGVGGAIAGQVGLSGMYLVAAALGGVAVVVVAAAVSAPRATRVPGVAD